MIPQRSILAGLAVAALAASRSLAPAQQYGAMDDADEMRDPTVLDVHLQSGPSFPVGDFTDFVNPGIHAGLGAEPSDLFWTMPITVVLSVDLPS